jgi:hypothetical protein
MAALFPALDGERGGAEVLSQIMLPPIPLNPLLPQAVIRSKRP